MLSLRFLATLLALLGPLVLDPFTPGSSLLSLLASVSLSALLLLLFLLGLLVS